MRRSAAVLLALGVLAAAGPAFAQSGGTVPVREDLRRWDRLEERLGHRDADSTGSLGPVQADPSGVAGFTGPPGGYGESVNSYDPLPHGAASSDIR